jgi:hypothetical protein
VVTVIPGFASAERAWENANPFDNECDCPPLFMCPACDKYATEAGPCCEEDGEQFYFHQIDREDCEEFAAESCNQHGYTDQDAADDAREHDRESRMGY